MSFARGRSTTLNTIPLENIFISVKTTPKYYENRIRVLKMTWFQVVKKDKVNALLFCSSYMCTHYGDHNLYEGKHLAIVKPLGLLQSLV